LSIKDIPPGPPVRWPNITLLLENAGHITVGQVAHIDGAAIAADENTVFVTVVRRHGESVEELFHRLDDALGRALHEGIRTNEVEGGHFVLATPRKRKGKWPS
jgi:hypothetical protein